MGARLLRRAGGRHGHEARRLPRALQEGHGAAPAPEHLEDQGVHHHEAHPPLPGREAHEPDRPGRHREVAERADGPREAERGRVLRDLPQDRQQPALRALQPRRALLRPLVEPVPQGRVHGLEVRRRDEVLDQGVSVNLFFTSFAKQARRSRKGGFTGCANVFSPIPVTA